MQLKNENTLKNVKELDNLNVKELLAQNRSDIWSLSDCNEIRTHNHLVKWLNLAE